jgi:hypothetical protein
MIVRYENDQSLPPLNRLIALVDLCHLLSRLRDSL